VSASAERAQRAEARRSRADRERRPRPSAAGARAARGRAAGLALALLCAACSRGPASFAELRERASAERWNLAFLVVDTLRADRLGCYGYAQARTPQLDALAGAGVRFSRAVAQSSWTLASMASLWTSLYPTQNGVTRWDHSVPESAVLPAEILRAHGFRTAGLYRNAFVAPDFGVSQGFDTYLRPYARVGRKRRPPQVSEERARHGSDRNLTLSAREFLQSFGRERFFLYLHYMDVHDYRLDRREFTARHPAFYDQGVAAVDREIGAFLAALEEAGVRSRTLVVVASDHGEHLAERRGLDGHGNTLYREVIEVPLIVAPPAFARGVVVDAVVENVDVWPTLLDLLGLPPLPDAQGRSLAPELDRALRGEAAPAAEAHPAFSHLDRTWMRPGDEPSPVVAVTDRALRLVQDLGMNDAYELYDAAADPAEGTNRAVQEDEEAARLKALAGAFVERPQASWAGQGAVSLDEETKAALRALGYGIP
jgi:arylsulfatase A-like enzyme